MVTTAGETILDSGHAAFDIASKLLPQAMLFETIPQMAWKCWDAMDRDWFGRLHFVASKQKLMLLGRNGKMTPLDGEFGRSSGKISPTKNANEA